jgi:molybdopterin/thiamine biosynthesis adenylyltransferase
MFFRQIELIGEGLQRRLEQLRVLVVGAGGLGFSIAQTLSCIGLKELVVVDRDRITPSNLHRQFGYALSDVGRYKVEVLEQLLNRCQTPVRGVVGWVGETRPEELGLGRGEWIIFDATDRVESRRAILSLSKTYRVPWVYAGVEEWHGAVAYLPAGRGEELIPATNLNPSPAQFPPLVGLVAQLAVEVGVRCWLGLEPPQLYYLTHSPHQPLQIRSLNLPVESGKD